MYTDHMTGTRWLSAQEQETWRAFLGACNAFFSAVDTQLQHDSGMPHAYYGSWCGCRRHPATRCG